MLDLILREGWLIDPERLTMLPGSLGVKDGKIAALFADTEPVAEAAFDCGGRTLRLSTCTATRFRRASSTCTPIWTAMWRAAGGRCCRASPRPSAATAG